MIYDFRFDRDAHLLTVRWHRIFTAADVLSYGNDYMRGFIAADFRSGYRLLMDMGSVGAQPQETLEPFMDHMRRIPKASRIAVCATVPLLRSQVTRLMTQPYLRMFDQIGEARRWVLA